AIANVGREDVMVEGLTPIHKGARVLGASSDHLMMDVTDADPPVKVGDRVAFRMNYGAMLLAMTSEYVEKVPLHGVEITPRGKMVQIVADRGAAAMLARLDAGARLEAMDYDVVEPGDAAGGADAALGGHRPARGDRGARSDGRGDAFGWP